MTTEVVQGAVLDKLVSESPADAQAPKQETQTPPEGKAQPEGAGAKAEQTALESPSPKSDPVGSYPEDWRERAAKGDAKKLAKLARFSSPEAVADAFIAANDKISTVGLREAAPTDPEALVRWRADNGIPDSPEKYDLKLKDGLVIGEMDKPMIDDFLKVAHSKNVSPEVVNEFTSWYFNKQEQAMQQFAVQESESRQNAERELVAEWGNNFTLEKNNINNFLKAQGLEDLQYARMPDGTAVGNSPEVLRKLSALAREINPGATVVPGAANASVSIDQEIAAIEKTMGTTAYTEDRGKQDRYMELLTAREKINARK